MYICMHVFMHYVYTYHTHTHTHTHMQVGNTNVGAPQYTGMMDALVRVPKEQVNPYYTHTHTHIHTHTQVPLAPAPDVGRRPWQSSPV